MSAVTVLMTPHDAPSTTPQLGEWRERDVVAACLIQEPAYVIPADRRRDENALLIARMRNALPELLRLAAFGRQIELNG